MDEVNRKRHSYESLFYSSDDWEDEEDFRQMCARDISHLVSFDEIWTGDIKMLEEKMEEHLEAERIELGLE